MLDVKARFVFSRAVDLVLTGGVVYDGTGGPGRPVEVGIRSGRFVLDPGAVPTASVIDVSGLALCPGFVDIHTHSDLTLLSGPSGPSSLRQGVTTQVVGNCGLGVAPLPAELAGGSDSAEIRSAAAYLDLDPAIPVTWRDIAGYLAALERARPAGNVATLVPHNPVRAGVVGFEARPSSVKERESIARLAAEGMDAGAVGVSTGLVYPPANSADDDELVALAEVVAERDKVFAWHVRDYADGLLPSVQQAIAVARRTGCRLQISHLAAVGRRNWGSVARALEDIDLANDDGCDIAVDCYPYLAGSAPLSQLLPAWALAGGETLMRSRLSESRARRAVQQEWRQAHFEWPDIMIAVVPADADDGAVGRTVAELAAADGREGSDLVLEMLAEHGHSVLMVAFGRDERDLRTVLAHPRSMVASDGLAIDPTGITGSAGLPHPRSFGCFPRFLSRYCDDLADGIRRCTSAPADRVGLRDRGRIADGLPADLVVFDPATLSDTATFAEPQQFPTGIALVLVNGQIAVQNDQQSATRSGEVLTIGPGTPRVRTGTARPGTWPKEYR